MIDVEFSKMTLSERITVVETRFGGSHPDRITQPSELFNVIGKTIYFVISPFGQEQDVGNGNIHEWVTDGVITNNERIIERADQILLNTEEKYMCVSYKDNFFNMLSIKDFNIIPNDYNNHAAFTTLEGAEAYVMFRKVQWAEDNNLTELADQFDFWITDEQLKESQKETK